MTNSTSLPTSHYLLLIKYDLLKKRLRNCSLETKQLKRVFKLAGMHIALFAVQAILISTNHIHQTLKSKIKSDACAILQRYKKLVIKIIIYTLSER